MIFFSKGFFQIIISRSFETFDHKLPTRNLYFKEKSTFEMYLLLIGISIFDEAHSNIKTTK